MKGQGKFQWKKIFIVRKVESLLDSPGPNVSMITDQSECDLVPYTSDSQQA